MTPEEIKERRKLLAKLMIDKDLTQEDIAREVNQPQGTVSKILSGKLRPAPGLAADMARVLGCSVVDLVPDGKFGRVGAVEIEFDHAAAKRAFDGHQTITEAALARQIGRSRQAVHQFLTGERTPLYEIAQALCSALGLDPDKAIRLVGASPIAAPAAKHPPHLEELRPLVHPLVAQLTDVFLDLTPIPYWEVRAGDRAEKFEEDAAGERAIPAQLIRGRKGRYLCIQARGFSMADPARANVQDGDYLLVRRTAVVKPGEIVVAIDEDGATLKRLAKLDGGLYLVAEPGPGERKFRPVKVTEATRFLGYVESVMKVAPPGGAGEGR